MSIEVLTPGLMTSLQDLGRYGYQKHGVIVSGAMDTYALRIANLLTGNSEGEAALEITLVGPKLKVEKGTLLAITGGNLSPVIEGKPVPMWRPVYITHDSILEFGACKSGCRTYLAVAGGYDVPAVMGSKSTYIRAGIGGFAGRTLKSGDRLKRGPLSEQALQITKHLIKRSSDEYFIAPAWYAGHGYIPEAPVKPVTVRMMKGRQFDFFTEDSKERLLRQPFTITTQSDRMGYRLSGEQLNLSEPLELISEAVALGTVQVPPDGNPIILLADRQTAGGYPKIGQLALVDVLKIAQAKPGSSLLFEEVTVEEAEQLYLTKEKEIETVKTALRLKLK